MNATPGKLLLTLLLAGLATLTPATHAAVVNINLTDTRGDGNTTTDDTLAGPYPTLFPRTITNWLGLSTGSGEIVIYNESGVNNGIGVIGTDYDVGGTGPSDPLTVSSTLLISAGSGLATPTNFSGGATIGSAGPWNSGFANQYFRYNGSPGAPSPNFAASPVSYLGFRIQDNLASTYNYGWLAVTWDGTNMNILSGAYETTANTAILAGATAPSPGPSSSVPDSSSTGALGLLLGGVLVRHWRRQRRAA